MYELEGEGSTEGPIAPETAGGARLQGQVDARREELYTT
jgi:hypothetical protein